MIMVVIAAVDADLLRVQLFIFQNLDHRKTKIIFGKNFAVFKHPCKPDEFYLRYQKPQHFLTELKIHPIDSSCNS